MFLEHRPQQPSSLRPNLALIWHGITMPARPALRTSESVIPLHKHRYMDASLFSNDYEKHSQYATTRRFCQQPATPSLERRLSVVLRPTGGITGWLRAGGSCP